MAEQKDIGKPAAFLAVAFITIVSVSIIAVLGGTLIWLIWPVAVPGAFPGLVASGALAAKLTWWQSVCLTWLFGFLLKNSGGSTKCPKEELKG